MNSLNSVTAHLHQTDQNASPSSQTQQFPLTTEETIEPELPNIIQNSLQSISQDKFHTLPNSVNGGFMVKIASTLLQANLTVLCSIILVYITKICANFGISQFIKGIAQLRHNGEFLKKMVDTFQPVCVDIPTFYIKMFIQRFLTEFTTSFSKRQNELLQKDEQLAEEQLTENDKQVIFHICGFLIHSLRKRYFRCRSSKSKQLLACLKYLEQSSSAEHLQVPSDWTDCLNRGGLKIPSGKFYIIFLQIERWVRNIVSTSNLNSDTLVNLKTRILDYRLLQLSWEKLFPQNHCLMILFWSIH